MGSNDRGQAGTAQGMLYSQEVLRGRDSIINAVNKNAELSDEERKAYLAEIEALGATSKDDQSFLAQPDIINKQNDLINRYTQTATAASARAAAARAQTEESAKLMTSPNVGLSKPSPAQQYFGSLAARQISGK